MIRKRQKRLVKKIKVAENCSFCRGKIEPDYKKLEVLKLFVSDRGKIVGKEYSGVCAKHQRGLTTEIKRARYLALLPFVNRIR